MPENTITTGTQGRFRPLSMEEKVIDTIRGQLHDFLASFLDEVWDDALFQEHFKNYHKGSGRIDDADSAMDRIKELLNEKITRCITAGKSKETAKFLVFVLSRKYSISHTKYGSFTNVNRYFVSKIFYDLVMSDQPFHISTATEFTKQQIKHRFMATDIVRDFERISTTNLYQIYLQEGSNGGDLFSSQRVFKRRTWKNGESSAKSKLDDLLQKLHREPKEEQIPRNVRRVKETAPRAKPRVEAKPPKFRFLENILRCFKGKG